MLRSFPAFEHLQMTRSSLPHRLAAAISASFIGLAAATACAGAFAQAPAPALAVQHVADLGRSLAVGDIVFTRIGAYPFRKVADATGTWTNHVGSVLHSPGLKTVFDGVAT
jgi:hypothetical protein